MRREGKSFLIYTDWKMCYDGWENKGESAMQYIVLDMEWNQPWPGTRAAEQTLESPIHGEIIQIGAVRVREDQSVCDEFQVLIRPKYYRKLNRKISKLTGIKDAELKENGVPFPEAVRRFRAWCGEDVIFLTWGFDDIRMLKENLRLFHLETSWTERWYNAQLIFNAQTDGSTAQKALKTAMELMNIEATRPAHDALGDAYHTALVCAKLHLKDGIRHYAKAMEKHENGFQSVMPPDCVERRVLKGYADRAQALAAMKERENVCPKCGSAMKAQRWISQPQHRYMARTSCPKCGGFLVRIRLQDEEDGTVRVGRLTYTGDSEAAQSYDRQREKARAAYRRRPTRRKRSAAQE